MGLFDTPKRRTYAERRRRWRQTIARALTAVRRALRQSEREDYIPGVRAELREAAKMLGHAVRHSR